MGKVATSPLPYRGSPPLQSGGQNQKGPTSGQAGYLTPAVSGIPASAERGAKSEGAHKWASWLPHPCRIGDPRPCRAGGKIRSGPQVGKLATSPLPYRGSPPLHSRGQNQKGPTSGQTDYLTPAVSGIPTVAERGAKSEVAHKSAKWLPHPCRIGDPRRCRAGGKIRSGPQVCKLATSPLLYLGSPPLQSGWQNQKWPTSGQIGYLTPAVSGIPTAAERGGQNQKWPTSGQSGYLTPAVSGIPAAAERGAKSEVAHKWAKWLPHPCRIGDPHRCRAGGKIRSGSQVGKVATSPLLYRGSPPLQSGGQNQKWPTSGQSGYLTPAVSGIPTASQRRQNQKWPTGGQSGYLTPAVSGIPTAAERGAKSEVAHKWANWLPHPCRIGDPHRFTAGGKIRSGPQVGKVATSPLPYRGSPPLQSGGQNQKWPTSGQSGYLTPAVSGIPTAAERGAKSEVAHKWAKWLPHPCRIGDPHRFTAEAKSEVANRWAQWLPHPCRIGDPHRCRAGGKIRSGPQGGKLATSPLPYRGSPPLHSGGKIRSGQQVGTVATSPLPYRGSPPLQSGGQNQKWPTSGQIGYLTPAVSGIPTASQRRQNQKWPTGGQSGYLTPAVSGIPTASQRRQNQKWPTSRQIGYLTPAVSGIPTASERRQNQKWPTSGQSGYLTPAVSGIPTAAERGAKSEVAHKGANWLPHPCRIGDPRRCRAGGKIRSGPQVGKLATSPLLYRGSPPLQSGWQNQKWLTSGQIGYLTPAVSGIPTAAERGAKSEVAHKWAKGKVATSPLPYRGSPPLQSGGQNQKGPTSGQAGYLTPAVSGIPASAERGAKSEVAHKWANWLPHPCRIGDPHRFRACGKIRSGPQVGKLATSPLLYRGSPPLHSGGQNQKWPTSGQSGYLTPDVSGIPAAAERGAKSEVAHKWAKWLPHPCRIGDPHRCRAGGKIRRGPQVGKLATSPLPYRGSPPLQSGGQNQKGPTSGQAGYLTPAVSGIPAPAERGAKSEVAHKWANWLPHPCRIGDPHRCTAGGKIRRGPQVGKLTTSPLPYRGSPPLQSGGQNQKWPTSRQSGYLTPAVSGIPAAAERVAKSEVAHKCANWLPHPCCIWDPHRFRAGGKIRSGPQVGKLATSPLPYRGSPPLQSGGGKIRSGPQVGKVATSPLLIGDPRRCRAGGKIRSGPQVGKVATSPLPYRGSPPLQSGGQNQKWLTSGQSGYLTPAISGIPTAAERGAKSEVAHKWAKWLPHPCRIGDPHRFTAEAKSEVANRWAQWLPHPCRIGDPHRCRAGGKIRSGPQVGKLATSPLPYRGSPPLHSGGKIRSGQQVGKVATSPPPYRGSPPLHSGGKIRSGPQVGKLATSPLPYRGSPPLQSGGKIRSGPQVGKVATSPLPYRGSPPLQSGGKIRSGPQVGKVATSPLPYPGSPPLQSGGQNQKWPTSGQSGYLTPAVSGIPTAAERGAKSEGAHKWASWLPHPCRIGDPRLCRAGGKIRSGPQVGKLATSPLPYRGSPPLQSMWQNQKWPTSGQIGYLTPAVSGIPTAAQRGAKSEVAHKWAKWLPHP